MGYQDYNYTGNPEGNSPMYYRRPPGRPTGTPNPGQSPQMQIDPSRTPYAGGALTTNAVAPAAAAAPAVAPADQPSGVAPTAPSGFYSPALEQLKKSYLLKDWQTPTATEGKVGGYMDTLAGAPVGLTDVERQGILNQARGNIMGTTQGLMDTSREAMGGRGFRAGESGIADTALAQIGRSGTEQMGQVATNLALSEAQNRPAQRLANLTAAGGMGTNLMSGENARLGTGLQTLIGGAGIEQFPQQLKAETDIAGGNLGLGYANLGETQNQNAMQNLFNLYGQGQTQQALPYSNYWSGLNEMYGTGPKYTSSYNYGG